MPATEDELLTEARQFLGEGNQRKALERLLELDDRFPPDAWVLESLARVHRRLLQPARGLSFVRRAQALGATDELTGLAGAMESDIEAAWRDKARFDLVTGRPGRAFESARRAASAPSPSTWTLRILTDAAVATKRQDEALGLIQQAVAARPDDPKLVEFEGRLGG